MHATNCINKTVPSKLHAPNRMWTRPRATLKIIIWCACALHRVPVHTFFAHCDCRRSGSPIIYALTKSISNQLMVAINASCAQRRVNKNRLKQPDKSIDSATERIVVEHNRDNRIDCQLWRKRKFTRFPNYGFDCWRQCSWTRRFQPTDGVPRIDSSICQTMRTEMTSWALCFFLLQNEIKIHVLMFSTNRCRSKPWLIEKKEGPRNSPATTLSFSSHRMNSQFDFCLPDSLVYTHTHPPTDRLQNIQ